MKRLLVAIAAVGLLAAGCGGGSETAAEGDGSEAESGSTPESLAGDAGDNIETLADFFGGADDPAEAQQQSIEQEARVQEAVRACMAEEGFEYIPVEQPAGSFAFDDTSQEDWAREQGFGITTWVGREDEFLGEEQNFVDPNDDMVAEMSDSEREAYYGALWGTEEEQQEGTTVEVDPDTGEEIFYQEGFGAGCYGEAQETEYGGQDDLWTELSPDLESMYERMQSDPRIVEANTEWSSCMAEGGYDYESPDTMYESVFDDFQQRLDEIVGPNGGYVDPLEGWTEEEINAFFEEKTEDEINAFFEEAQNAAPEYDQEALASLQQEEIDLAVAAAECQSTMDEAFEEVYAEYESEFIDEHRSELESIKAAQEG